MMSMMENMSREDHDDHHHKGSDHDHDQKKNRHVNFCKRHVRDPCRSFGKKCSLLVKEQRARFYILRRCITMLLCWRDCGDL